MNLDFKPFPKPYGKPGFQVTTRLWSYLLYSHQAHNGSEFRLCPFGLGLQGFRVQGQGFGFEGFWSLRFSGLRVLKGFGCWGVKLPQTPGPKTP